MTSRFWLWVKNNSILTSSTIALSFLLMLAASHSASAAAGGQRQRHQWNDHGIRPALPSRERR